MLPMATGFIFLDHYASENYRRYRYFFAGDSMPCYSLKNFIIDLVNVFSLKIYSMNNACHMAISAGVNYQGRSDPRLLFSKVVFGYRLVNGRCRIFYITFICALPPRAPSPAPVRQRSSVNPVDTHIPPIYAQPVVQPCVGKG